VASDGYLRFPHLHADLLTFVADDDVWLAPADGGRPWRLSADRARASYPRLARDGRSVAWTCQRDGVPDVYQADLDGGVARRLTFWGDESTRVTGWSPDGELLAVTAYGQPFSHHTWAHSVRPGDGAFRRLPFGPVADLAIEPAAVALLTGRHRREPAFWKRYRGGTAGRLWVTRTEVSSGQPGDGRPQFSRVAADLPGQLASPMIVGGRLVFLADHEGTGNLYSCALDGTGLRRHTDHDGFYARNPSTDGQRIVYHCAGDIWILDDLDDQARPLDIRLASPLVGRSPRLISAEDHLGGLSCDHTGQASAVEVLGTVHWLTHRDGPARALAVTPRARLPRVLGRTGQVVWVSDAGGEQALEIAPADGQQPPGTAPAEGTAAAAAPAGPPQARSVVDGTSPPRVGRPGDIDRTGSGGAPGLPAGPPRRLAAGQLGRVTDIAAAPDGRTVAVAARDGRLLVVDVASGQVTELAASADGAVTGLAYSPDSAWLAWAQPGPRPLSRIRIARLPDGLIADVTDGRFTDTEPAFTADGRYLAFLSGRSFDPVYDAHFFDLSFPLGCRPYLVPLAADAPSPFGPLPQGRPVSHGTDGDDRDEAEPGLSAVTVDTEGLAARVVRVPVPESLYSSLRPVKGGLAWLREPLSGALGEGTAEPGGRPPRAGLERFDLERRQCTELVGEFDWFEVSGDGTKLVVSDQGDLRVLGSGAKDDSEESGDLATVNLSRARYMADPVAWWRHAYNEAGRIMRHDFWVDDMAGVDWAKVLDEYRPLLGRIAGSEDFADLLLEVFGELATSHAYVRTASDGGGDGRPVGLLGADLERGENGGWRITRVLPGESSDPRARSPLATPGVVVRPGDGLLAVDGQPVDPVTGPGPLLVGAAGVPAELTVASPGGDDIRRAVVVPLDDDSRLRYQDWVAGRRRTVRELGGGRIGYLHVPDMMEEGWADFHRDLRLEMTHDALIVDVRGNRGGHVSQLVVEKLARRVLGWDVPRGLMPATYPQDAPRGPVVALSDEFAGSDGDIVTAAIRALRLGPVIGARTWGGVIGIDGMAEHVLVDGTAITVPRYATWIDGYGWNLENRGAEPDVEVLNSPADWAAGRDAQLEAAVRVALEALEARPAAAAPDTAQRPSKLRPPLPPRPGAAPAGGGLRPH
jgi:tricorn protease